MNATRPGRELRPDSKLVAAGLAEVKAATAGKLEDRFFDTSARLFDFGLGRFQVVTVKHQQG